MRSCLVASCASSGLASTSSSVTKSETMKTTLIRFNVVDRCRTTGSSSVFDPDGLSGAPLPSAVTRLSMAGVPALGQPFDEEQLYRQSIAVRPTGADVAIGAGLN